jgi:hypothetical protein
MEPKKFNLYDGKCEHDDCTNDGFYSKLFDKILCTEHYSKAIVYYALGIVGILAAVFFSIIQK